MVRCFAVPSLIQCVCAVELRRREIDVFAAGPVHTTGRNRLTLTLTHTLAIKSVLGRLVLHTEIGSGWNDAAMWPFCQMQKILFVFNAIFKRDIILNIYCFLSGLVHT